MLTERTNLLGRRDFLDFSFVGLGGAALPKNAE